MDPQTVIRNALFSRICTAGNSCLPLSPSMVCLGFAHVPLRKSVTAVHSLDECIAPSLLIPLLMGSQGVPILRCTPGIVLGNTTGVIVPLPPTVPKWAEGRHFHYGQQSGPSGCADVSAQAENSKLPSHDHLRFHVWLSVSLSICCIYPSSWFPPL